MTDKDSIRWEQKIIRTDGCWEWIGCLSQKGYGRFWVGGGKTLDAHKIAYEKAFGPVPMDMVIDHLCRNRSCVNPEHMEVVTNSENVLRGTGHTANNKRKTHCPNGHLYEGTNLYVTPEGYRGCRACRNDHSKTWKRTHATRTTT